MLLFLKLVGAFLVALVIFAIGLIMVFRWSFRRHIRRLNEITPEDLVNARTQVPPFRIQLENKDDEDRWWNHDDEMNRLTAEFEAAGFTQIGDFVCRDLGLELRAFQHQECLAYGVLYDHHLAGCWCDVVRRYADETTWTVSSSKKHGMDSAPWHHPHFMEGGPVAELLKQLRDTSPDKGMEKVGADRFVIRFEAAYAREMDWRIERGGPTAEEIRRIASTSAESDCTDEEVERVQRQWKAKIAKFLSEQVLTEWQQVKKTPRRKFDRIKHQLTVVHERMLPEQLLELVDEDYFYSELDDDFDESEFDEETLEYLDEVRDWCRTESALKVFRRILKDYEMEDQWKLKGTVAKPVKAEIWVSLDNVDEDDELWKS